MELFIYARKQRIQPLAFGDRLLHGVEIGFDETGVQCIYLFHGIHICNCDGVWTKSNDVAVLTMQAHVVDFGAASPDDDESPEISVCGEPRSWYVVKAISPFVRNQFDS